MCQLAVVAAAVVCGYAWGQQPTRSPRYFFFWRRRVLNLPGAVYYVMPESREYGIHPASVHTGIAEKTSRTVKDRETTDNFPGSMTCSRGIVHTLNVLLVFFRSLARRQEPLSRKQFSWHSCYQTQNAKKKKRRYSHLNTNTKHGVCFDTLEQLPKTSKTLPTPDTKKTAATTSATVWLRRLPSHGHDFPRSTSRHFRQTKVPDNVASCFAKR